MIDKNLIYKLKESKNLLAFSAGVDSSALFFLLLENHIPFDIALVNYGTRENSDNEEAHAKALAKQYGLQCYTIKAPKFQTHFEQQARTFRYNFFERLIEGEGYETVITAHQLNDQLEWLLMRLTKGAGVSELIGLEPVSERKGYLLLRPLLNVSRDELSAYLEAHDYPYFLDESNSDETYERNRFRKHFSDPLLSEYKEGIKRTLNYLRKDKSYLESDYELLHSIKELRVVKLHTKRAKVKAVDLMLKELGYLLSAQQRNQVEREQSLVIGGKWSIEMTDNRLYIAPYVTVTMPKAFKESCRKLHIPTKIRAYCFSEKLELSLFD